MLHRESSTCYEKERFNPARRFHRKDRVIYLSDRNMMMMKSELSKLNPLRHLGLDLEILKGKGGFGAVMAPAGVGKTALLVQIALLAMMKEFSILHVSLNDPVNKVTLWYDEILQDLTQAYPSERVQDLREDILLHRFIMTFRVDDFSVPKLEERLNDLTVQNIFQPHILIIDGLHFNSEVEPFLVEMKALAEKHHFFVWFSVHIHREEEKAKSGMPLSIEGLHHYFQVILKIEEKGDYLSLQAIKGGLQSTATGIELRLDPTTMLIND